MEAFTRIAKPLLPALLSTGLGVLAFACLTAAGCGSEPSLVAALILAGLLNIYALISSGSLPIYEGAVGEL